jgi:hypothetical protein
LRRWAKTVQAMRANLLASAVARPATLAFARQHFDLLGNLLDALIETPPIAAEVLDDPDHTRRQHVDALGQNLLELLTQKTKSLAHSNAALQEEATDLVDHSRPLAD